MIILFDDSNVPLPLIWDLLPVVFYHLQCCLESLLLPGSIYKVWGNLHSLFCGIIHNGETLYSSLVDCGVLPVVHSFFQEVHVQTQGCEEPKRVWSYVITDIIGLSGLREARLSVPASMPLAKLEGIVPIFILLHSKYHH